MPDGVQLFFQLVRPFLGEQTDAGRSGRGGKVHRTGIATNRHDRPFGQGRQLEQVGPADKVPGAGFLAVDLGPDIALVLAADNDRGDPGIGEPA